MESLFYLTKIMSLPTTIPTRVWVGHSAAMICIIGKPTGSYKNYLCKIKIIAFFLLVIPVFK